MLAAYNTHEGRNEQITFVFQTNYHLNFSHNSPLCSTEKSFLSTPLIAGGEPAVLQAGLSLGIQQPKVVFNIMGLRFFLIAQENSCLHRQAKTLRPAARIKPRFCLAASVV
jgi:hypothetical protein